MVLQNNIRASAVDGPPVRQMQVRAIASDEGERTFSAVTVTDNPCAIFDFRSGETVMEILHGSGGKIPLSVPLLDAHKRDSMKNVIGVMTDFKLMVLPGF